MRRYCVCVVLLGILASIGAVAASKTELHFDETVDHAVGYAISQWDPRMRDLFGDHGKQSNLCWPTALANSAVYLRFNRSPSFDQLMMPGELLKSGIVDKYTQQVRYFRYLCRTNVDDGTYISNGVRCIRSYFKYSGYEHPWARILGADALSDPDHLTPPAYQRAVELDDFRDYLDQDYGVILEIGYFHYHPETHDWRRKSGHVLSVVGYDYNYDWKDGHLLLHVVDPGQDYSHYPKDHKWDEYSIVKLPIKDGFRYPKNIQYFMAGPGYIGRGNIPFVENLIVFLPELH